MGEIFKYYKLLLKLNFHRLIFKFIHLSVYIIDSCIDGDVAAGQLLLQ